MSFTTYATLFVLMMVEGPITTIVASFLASQEVLNMMIVFLLAVLGDIVADIILFYMGKSSKHKFFDKIKKRKHIGKEQINKIKEKVQEKPFQTIFIIKATALIATVGLIIVGSSKIKTVHFLFYATLASLINKTVYASIGFFGGLTIVSFLRGNEFAQFSIPFLILIIIAFIFIIIWLKRRLMKMYKLN